MNEFDQVLDDALGQIAGGAATADECLAQHPEYAEQLGPLLQAAARLERGRMLATPEGYKTLARDQLTAYMLTHPRRNRRKLSLVWNVATSVVVLVMAFFITGTAVAQGALPGQPLYDWKLSSEQVWRASVPDRVGVDLQLADRRTLEITSLSADSVNEARALSGYREVLARLSTEADAKNNDRILHTLKSNQLKLSAAGIKIPELDAHLSH
jgi:hypothetical protein